MKQHFFFARENVQKRKCCVCAFVLLRCFSCSHTVLPKEHSLGVIFFSSILLFFVNIFLQYFSSILLAFHYWLYSVWLCMWRIIKNLERSHSQCVINMYNKRVNNQYLKQISQLVATLKVEHACSEDSLCSEGRGSAENVLSSRPGYTVSAEYWRPRPPHSSTPDKTVPLNPHMIKHDETNS